MQSFSYLDGWWLSLIISCTAIAVPSIRVGPQLIRRFVANFLGFIKVRKSRLSLIRFIFSLVITFVLSILGLLAVLVSCTALFFATAHAIVNFGVHVYTVGMPEAFTSELSNGVLALRLSSITMFTAFVMAVLRFFYLNPKLGDVNSAAVGTRKYSHKVATLLTRRADEERTFIESDNELRGELRTLRHRLLPTNVFIGHMLHLGFLSLAVLFCWVLISSYSSSSAQAALSWLTLFSSHDAGLVFGYYYMLKGRLLGWHERRMLGLYALIVLIMSYLCVDKLMPIGLNIALLLGTIAMMAAGLLVGLLIFAPMSRRLADDYYRAKEDNDGRGA